MITPLFLCGFGSGGTDLTKNILNAHPNIHLFSELPHLPNIQTRGYSSNTRFTTMRDVILFRDLLRNLHHGDNFENIDEQCAADLLSSELAQKGALNLDDVLKGCLSTSKAEIWGAKIPVRQIGAVSQLFPSAGFLIVTRDVRDVCLSWRSKWGKDIVWCAGKWAARMARGLELARELGSGRYLVVKFEDLLSATEDNCQQICRFLRIPFSPRMCNYHEHTARWDGKRNYGQPIISTNKDKWRNELSQLSVTRLEEIAFDTMKLLGYHPEFATYSRPITRFETMRGMCLDSWAILSVGNRALERNTLGRRVETALNVLRGVVLRKREKL